MSKTLDDPRFARVPRRDFLRGAGALAMAGAPAAALLSACGSDDSDAADGELTGPIRLQTYPGWLGENEIAKFKKRTGVTVKEVSAQAGTNSAVALAIQQNPKAYDLVLADVELAARLQANDLVLAVDEEAVPNLRRVADTFRRDYPHGIPTDYGKIGFAYRRDLVDTELTSWSDVWSVASRYSGRILFLNNDRDVLGNTLRYLGYSGNSTDEGELDECKEALLEIKPHLLAFAGIDVSKRMRRGEAVIAMNFDFDVALAQQEDENIVWVVPEEGLMGYLEGWVAISEGEHISSATAFMDFHLEPRNYADFVNTTGTAYVVPAADRFIRPEIRDNATIAFDQDVLEKVEFYEPLGAATQLWDRIWDEVRSA